MSSKTKGGFAMSLLKPAENQTAKLKAGILGFAGSGKTYTATDIAIGLAKMDPKKHVAFFDTETGSDYVIDKVKREGLQFSVAKTRAFRDLLTVVKEAEQGASVLIIDSISHVWAELLESYMRKKNKERLSVGTGTRSRPSGVSSRTYIFAQRFISFFAGGRLSPTTNG
jgi:hypothetical protein